MGTVLLANALVVLACMLVLWRLACRSGDPSFIDAFWPFGFVLIAALSAAMSHGDPTRRAVLLALTAVWGLRLSAYLLWRWRRSGPDPRYTALLRRAADPARFMLTHVFLLQGALMWIVALPLPLGMHPAAPAGLSALGFAGIGLSALGIAFESVGDAQLARFRSDPANRGQVMDRGLWRYTRHPNYFGDACHWWGVFLVSVVDGVTALGVIGPLVMTFLLVRWSGAALLERRLLRSRPGYADYVRRTSGFVPLPPKRPAPAGPHPSPEVPS